MSDKFCAAKEGNYPHTVEGIKQFYDEWAPNYAKDLTHDNYTAPRWLAETIAKLVINKDANIMDMACGTGLVAQEDITEEGYTGPRWAAATMAKWLTNKDAEIMDMACGTGMQAHELTQQGFKNIDGVDISPESLKFSKERGIYRRLICSRIGTNKLDIQDDSYDGLVLGGALGSGHLNLECVPQLIRIVKPGGLIILDVDAASRDTTVDAFKYGKFEADLEELVRKGLWVKVAYELIPEYLFNTPGHQYAYKVL
ncbi:methyltransferase-like protein 27 isoform X1 [Amphiura filiformis]|uniref:methyltransferase-like protein 27 isoform X1 n=1 Tax=Amphiura filiformis TaxID=82378 RepID=UPI003B21CBF7